MADGRAAETRDGTIVGLGLDQAMTLTCDRDELLGAFRFHSPWLRIDPTAIGCITASIPSASDTTTFHTVGALDC